MEAFFIELMNMSYQAAIVVCFILAARWLASLAKVPKKYSCMLWAIPFIRMLIPIHLESVLSLLPAKEPFLPENIGYMQVPQVNTGSSAADVLIRQALPQATPQASVNPMQIVLFMLQIIWMVGVAGLVVCSVVSYIRLFLKLRCSMHYKDNIWLADRIATPFVLGIFRPRIYVPSDTTKEAENLIFAHEQMHIKRKDYLVKPAAFCITVAHWFNPFAWAAYLLLCRDMEMACDEAVMQQCGADCRGEYANLLLNYTAGKKLNGVPLALSEGNPKKRIRHIMKYKKPLFWVSAVAVIALILLAVGLLSNPVTKKGPNTDGVVKDGIYKLVSDKEMVGAGITIDGEYMIFVDSPINSFIYRGKYSIEDDILTLKVNRARTVEVDGKQEIQEYEERYRFRVEEDSLIFIAEGSGPVMHSGVPEIDSVVDGSVFQWVEPLRKPAEESERETEQSSKSDYLHNKILKNVKCA